MNPFNSRKKIFLVFCLAGILTAGLVAAGCDRTPAPVRIGFSGCLSGRLSDLGISGRSGVILAAEEINRTGGINGRPVELLVRDDRHDPFTAVEVDRELIEAGVAGIIGHMTSTMALATLPLLNEKKVVSIAPTASTDLLTGKDDYLIRVVSANQSETSELARYAVQQKGVKKVSLLCDLSNDLYTRSWLNHFQSEFQTHGGEILHSGSFTSGEAFSYLELAHELLHPETEGIVIAAGALDTAMFCQQIRKLGSDVLIISSGWAQTPDLIQHGGSAVEGMVFSQLFNRDSRNERYLAFRKRFLERFEQEPDFASVLSYEAAQVLFDAIARANAGTPDAIRQAILDRKTYKGIHGDFTIDEFGDAHRQRFLITIRNQEFVTLESP